MKAILDLCGGTGSWSRPYVEAGYYVSVITLPKDDVRLFIPPDNVYSILAAPPCDQFSIAKYFHGKGNYNHDFRTGLEIVSACCRIILMTNPVFWVIENPATSMMKKWLGKPTMIFDPWEYGEGYQKTTALWGKFNTPLPTVKEKPPGLHKFSMLKSKDICPEFYGKYSRQIRRAITPPKFAQAFFEANS